MYVDWMMDLDIREQSLHHSSSGYASIEWFLRVYQLVFNLGALRAVIVDGTAQCCCHCGHNRS